MSGMCFKIIEDGWEGAINELRFATLLKPSNGHVEVSYTILPLNRFEFFFNKKLN